MARGGEYNVEIHVTVEVSADVVTLERAAQTVGGKVTQITLAQGATPVQPMITFHGKGSIKSQLKRAKRLTGDLRNVDIEVVRTKIEVDLDEALWGHGAPSPPRWLYAEQHIRVRLHPTEEALVQLQHDAVALGAHVSRTPNARSAGAFEERFVTSRVYNDAATFPPYDKQNIDSWSHRDHRVLAARFEAVAAGLRQNGWGIVSGDRELVLHDTNFELDAGWLPQTQPQSEELSWIRQSPQLWPNSWTTPAPRDLAQPRLFDPSMKHMTSAYRRGDPQGEGSQAWMTIRSEIFRSVLTAVATSPLSDSLCVRGSVMLPHFLGSEVSRVPGDIDWVVVPSTIEVNDDHGIGMLEALKQLMAEQNIESVTLHTDDAVLDSIWTYDRVPGRRMTIPWTSKTGVPGSIQMDFVFGEDLWTPPISIPLGDDGASILAASPEQSLAWKLLWLASDMHPQGKDLYDAVLLAETYEIAPELVERAFAEGHEWRPHRLTGRSVIESWPIESIEWSDLIAEYPGITGTAVEWKDRLAEALFPTDAKM